MRHKINIIFILLSMVWVISGCDTGPKVEWQKFDEKIFDEAILSSKKPTLVYFYAAWCGACRQLEATTFHDSRVIASLEKWNRFKADMSFRESKTTFVRQQRFKIWGLPTLIWYSASGRELFRESGWISGKEFVEMTERVIS